MTPTSSQKTARKASAVSGGESYDCVIIGGGPAGATVATLLADYGHKVLLLEKSTFPRHHVGESLMPETYWTFKRIGMLEKLKASDFPRKQSIQFVSASGKESQPFYFTDRDPNEWSVTWQVTRPAFDKMMLDNAREHGAEIREGVRMKEVLFKETRAVGVRAIFGDAAVNVFADVVVDATGQSAVLSRQLNLRYPDNQLKNASIYAYYEGATRDTGRNAGATVIIHMPDRNGWFWFIPLSNDVASIGVVAPPSYLFAGRGDDSLATLEKEIAGCPGIASRLAQARRVSQVYVTGDSSFRAKRAAGDGWVLVGDAFGFLDPVYSSGVMLALKSGEFAADAIHEGLQTGDVSGERIGAFAPKLVDGMQLIRQLIYAFYDRRFSFREFLQAHPQYHDHLVRILIGDVFKNDLGEMFDAMRPYVDLPEHIELESGSRLPGGGDGPVVPK